MHQKTPYKFNAGNGQFLPLSFFPVILNRKSNIFIIHMDDAVIADGDPMGILSKVINHRLCTVKSFLTVRNPFCVVTGIYKFFELIKEYKGRLPRLPACGLACFVLILAESDYPSVSLQPITPLTKGSCRFLLCICGYRWSFHHN